MINTLDPQFHRAIEETTRPDTVLRVFLKKYLHDKKVFIFQWQADRFLRSVDSDQPKLKLFWFNRVFCQLSQAELAQYLEVFFEYANTELEKFLAHFEASVESVTTKVIETAATGILTSMFKTSDKMIRNRKQISKRHRFVVEEVWGDALHVIRMEIEMAKEIHDEVVRGRLQGGGVQWNVMVKLFEQSCLVSTEIYTLLENGFPDAAFARWRTLHEIAVIFQFIRSNAEAVATMFLEHQIVSNYKEMNVYIRRHEELGLAKIDLDDQTRIETEYREALRKYGTKYKEDYGWASSVIQSDRIHFADIEESVQQDYLKPYYKLACNNVHAGAKGIYYKIGVLDHTQGLVGESFVGLADPIQLTSLSLCSITSGLLLRVGTFTSTVEMRVLTMLAEKLQELIPEIVETEDEALFRRTNIST